MTQQASAPKLWRKQAVRYISSAIVGGGALAIGLSLNTSSRDWGILPPRQPILETTSVVQNFSEPSSERRDAPARPYETAQSAPGGRQSTSNRQPVASYAGDGYPTEYAAQPTTTSIPAGRPGIQQFGSSVPYNSTSDIVPYGHLSGPSPSANRTARPRQPTPFEMQRRALVLRLQSQPNNQRQPAQLEELKKLLEQEFDERHAAQLEKLRVIQEATQEAAAVLSQRQEQRDQIIDRHFRSLLGQRDALDWEYEPLQNTLPNNFGGSYGITTGAMTTPPARSSDRGFDPGNAARGGAYAPNTFDSQRPRSIAPIQPSSPAPLEAEQTISPQTPSPTFLSPTPANAPQPPEIPAALPPTDPEQLTAPTETPPQPISAEPAASPELQETNTAPAPEV